VNFASRIVYAIILKSLMAKLKLLNPTVDGGLQLKIWK